MAEIGRKNRLTIKTKLGHGLLLDGGTSGDILLLNKYAPETYQLGDEIAVFVYADREERLLATTETPHATVGQFARLRVVSSTSAGTYLDWGMQKDLLVPRAEQQVKMAEGKSYIVFVFLDKKSNRIAASSRLDKFLGLRPPDYAVGTEVDLLICDRTDLGYKVIVDDAHWGMIYKNEVFQDLQTGRRMKGYIKRIREDLKIDIRLQQPGYQGIDTISRNILEKIRDSGGTMAVTDKSPPGTIYAHFGVSKKTFKKAIGTLYKKRLITIHARGVRLCRTSGRKGNGFIDVKERHDGGAGA